MTSKELFKKLGYKEYKMSNSLVRYESKKTETCISFITSKEKGNRIHIYAIGETYQDSGMITYAELKAINLKVRELGWKDDTKEQMEWIEYDK